MTTTLDHLLAQNPPPLQPQEDLVAWLRGRTLDELAAIEVREACVECRGTGRASGEKCPDCDGDGKARRARVLIPDAFTYRNARGEVCEEPILFAVPRERDYLRATVEAVQLVARENPKLKVETADDARGVIGHMRFENLENAAIVARSARDRKPPHGRLYLLHVLVDTYDPPVIHAAFERLDALYRLWDVRVGELTEVQFWAFVSEVARVRNASPLAVLGAALQRAFLLRMASELQRFRTSSSSDGSPKESTPAPSPPTTSE